MFDVFSGVIIRTDPNLVENGEPYEVRRTWYERLFTRPWRPLTTTRWVVPKVPMKSIIHLSDGTMIMHPTTLEEMKATLIKEDTHEH
jgi:hypothetical protein